MQTSDLRTQGIGNAYTSALAFIEEESILKGIKHVSEKIAKKVFNDIKSYSSGPVDLSNYKVSYGIHNTISAFFHDQGAMFGDFEMADKPIPVYSVILGRAGDYWNRNPLLSKLMTKSEYINECCKVVVEKIEEMLIQEFQKKQLDNHTIVVEKEFRGAISGEIGYRVLIKQIAFCIFGTCAFLGDSSRYNGEACLVISCKPKEEQTRKIIEARRHKNNIEQFAELIF